MLHQCVGKENVEKPGFGAEDNARFSPSRKSILHPSGDGKYHEATGVIQTYCVRGASKTMQQIFK